MPKLDELPPTVPISGRTPPEVRRMAELAAEVEGHDSLSKWVGAAVEREAFRTIVRRGLERQGDRRGG